MFHSRRDSVHSAYNDGGGIFGKVHTFLTFGRFTRTTTQEPAAPMVPPKLRDQGGKKAARDTSASSAGDRYKGWEDEFHEWHIGVNFAQFENSDDLIFPLRVVKVNSAYLKKRGIKVGMALTRINGVLVQHIGNQPEKSVEEIIVGLGFGSKSRFDTAASGTNSRAPPPTISEGDEDARLSSVSDLNQRELSYTIDGPYDPRESKRYSGNSTMTAPFRVSSAASSIFDLRLEPVLIEDSVFHERISKSQLDRLLSVRPLEVTFSVPLESARHSWARILEIDEYLSQHYGQPDPTPVALQFEVMKERRASNLLGQAVFGTGRTTSVEGTNVDPSRVVEGNRDSVFNWLDSSGKPMWFK